MSTANSLNQILEMSPWILHSIITIVFSYEYLRFTLYITLTVEYRNIFLLEFIFPDVFSSMRCVSMFKTGPEKEVPFVSMAVKHDLR
jgi:hypothetical protein